jgi:hypothetical protein
MSQAQTIETPAKATLSELRTQPQDVANLPTVNVGLSNLQSFELAQRAAKLLSSSTIVPKEYVGNIANCVVALNMAARIGADPLQVMQNLIIVHGKPTWSSQFMIATVNSCGRFSALRYEFFGKQGTDEWGCRAWAVEKATGEKLIGTDITIGLAKKEGWYSKSGSKWQTMPQQMLMYRAGSWWARAYAPELSMGLHTADEMRDVIDAEKLEDGTYTVSDLREAARTEPQAEEPAKPAAGGNPPRPPAAKKPAKPKADPETGEIAQQVADENTTAAASVPNLEFTE